MLSKTAYIQNILKYVCMYIHKYVCKHIYMYEFVYIISQCVPRNRTHLIFSYPSSELSKFIYLKKKFQKKALP